VVSTRADGIPAYTVLLIDGPRHGVVIPMSAWPGLILRFPVPKEHITIDEMTNQVVSEMSWLKIAEYYNWARMGNILVFKFEGIK
jgi:hypothetical protein